MPAYMIGRININSTEWMDDYRPKTAELVAKHGGKYLVAGGPFERVEGDGAAPDALVVLEFPDMDAAKAWYNDPEYKPMIELRQTGAVTEAFLVEGAG